MCLIEVKKTRSANYIFDKLILCDGLPASFPFHIIIIWPLLIARAPYFEHSPSYASIDGTFYGIFIFMNFIIRQFFLASLAIFIAILERTSFFVGVKSTLT